MQTHTESSSVSPQTRSAAERARPHQATTARAALPDHRPVAGQLAQLAAILNPASSGEQRPLTDRGQPAPRAYRSLAAPGTAQRMMKRPGFVGPVTTMRSDAQELYPGDPIHMAHRLSFQAIREILLQQNLPALKGLISRLCVPQRNFGPPGHGGVAAGDQGYYNAVLALGSAKGWFTDEMLSALNSCPYNLRPGHGPTNSAIQGDPDAHFDETKPGEPMTPQSASLLAPGTVDSSDFMTMATFADWESDFGSYLSKAIAAVHRLAS